MQINLLGTALHSELQGGEDVIFVAVYAAIGEQAPDVYGFVIGDGFIDGCAIGRVFKEGAVGDVFVDARQLLPHHAPRAQRHVADFAVAELPFGQAHI